MLTFGEQVIDFVHHLPSELKLPSGIELLQPFNNPLTRDITIKFYSRFYNDFNPRTFIFGINPGRLGAGITGIPFTDPINLKIKCGIQNNLTQKHELSSLFVYRLIDAMGGAGTFYNHFYITAVCPLGFIRENRNLNYYDDKKLEKQLTSFMIDSIQKQIRFGAIKEICYCWGEGKNYAFLNALNTKYQWFDKIIPLPHPRWIMQYRRTSAEDFVEQFKSEMSASFRN
jgi:hypothetical protein